jgi:phosphoglycerate dehydrogenase-like enzyme
MNERPNVLVWDEILAQPVETLRGEFFDMEINVAVEEAERKAWLAGANAIVVQQEPLGRDLIAEARELQLLMKMGRMYENIEVEAARERDIPLAFVPRKGPNSVAELAVSLILALSKNLIQAHRNVVEGAYRRRGLVPSLTTQQSYSFQWMKMARVHEIRGKTLGVVGLGEIGTELSRRANALGMKVVYHNRTRRSTEFEERYRVEYAGLHDLLEASDYVVLAVPQTPATEHMIGAEELARIGPGGYLVNVCRGRVVDEEALIDALRQGHIAGAGLDVFAYEPLPGDSPLCALDNVILTPHIGGSTGPVTVLELRETLVEVASILLGSPPKDPI